VKTRVLVAAIAIPFVILIILLAPTWLLGAVMGAVSALCAWEFVRCAEVEIKRRMLIYSAVSAFCIPLFVALFPAGMVYEIVLFCLTALVFSELMLSFRRENPMDFETAAVVVLAGGVLPILLSAIVRLDLREHGSVYALLPFVVAFTSDSAAYFAGLFLGRHKLTPRLSPNKTVEGSVGGFVGTIAVVLLYGLILKAAKFEVDFAVLTVYAFLGSLASQLGDLSFSAIKRLCGVKDFGTVLPGHGGMLDRFDSMFWTAALLELLVSWVPAIKK
jgi:phosphatidate cytidylyltransferase